MGKAKLRYVDLVTDTNGMPVPHPTKPGQIARNGGQIPLIGEDGYPHAVLPGDVFEVDRVIAEDLLRAHAQTGMVVLESDYQKRKIRIDSQRPADDPARNALASVYQAQTAQKEAARRLAAKVRQRQAMDAAEAADVPAVDLAALVAAEVAKARQQDAERIALLEKQLVAQVKPAPASAAPAAIDPPLAAEPAVKLADPSEKQPEPEKRKGTK